LTRVRKWARLHEADLINTWSRAQDRVPLRPIAPLE
jgi:hypothetical protein